MGVFKSLPTAFALNFMRELKAEENNKKRLESNHIYANVSNSQYNASNIIFKLCVRREHKNNNKK